MKSRLIALVNVVVYAIFMVLCVLLGISGKKQSNEKANALKSKLQKQDPVVGVVAAVRFPEGRDTKMVGAIVEDDARRYNASVPPGTKVGDEVQILLHEGYAIHSSFRDDPLNALYSAGSPVRNKNKKESLTLPLMTVGTLFFPFILGATLLVNSWRNGNRNRMHARQASRLGHHYPRRQTSRS